MKKYIIAICLVLFMAVNVHAGRQYFRDNQSYVDSNGDMSIDSISAGDGTLNITDDMTLDADEALTTTSHVVTDGGTIGLGSGKGLIQFDDETTDFVSFSNCNVGIGDPNDGIYILPDNSGKASILGLDTAQVA